MLITKIGTSKQFLKNAFELVGTNYFCARNTRTAGLPVSLTWGLRHNFCCRGPILIPRPVLEFPAQTTRGNVLDFFVKPKDGDSVSFTKRR